MSRDAIGCAFAHASTHRLGLIAVHAWWDDYVDSRLSPGALDEARDALVTQRHLMVADALAPHRARFPDVEVQVRLDRSRPVDLLGQESEGARLLVVGSRGLGGFAGLVLGSVSQAVLHRAHCPVEIVRPTAGLDGRRG